MVMSSWSAMLVLNLLRLSKLFFIADALLRLSMFFLNLLLFLKLFFVVAEVSLQVVVVSDVLAAVEVSVVADIFADVKYWCSSCC